MILQAAGNAPGSESDLSGDKVFAASLGFVVEENAVTGEDSIRFTILPDHPVPVLLGNRIGTVWVEGCVFILRYFFNFAVEFTCACLIYPTALIKAGGMNCFQNTENTERVDVSCVLGCIEGDLNMALCGEIVDFIRLYLQDNADDAGGIRQIAFMENKPVKDVIDAGCCGNGGSPHNTMHLISFIKQKLCKIRSVLPGYSSDQSFFHIDTAPSSA